MAEVSADGSTWRREHLKAGTAPYEAWFVDLAPIEGRADGRVRFRLRTNGSLTSGGVAIDDLHVYCEPIRTDYSGGIDEFFFMEGTSMAAPHVAGTAALVLSVDASLSGADLAARLRATADPVPALAGRLATGGRLNAARAVDLPPPAPPAPAPAPPPAAPAQPAAPRPPSGPTAAQQARVAAALGVVARVLAGSLGRTRIRTLLRRGGVTATGLTGCFGRLRLELRDPRRRTLAAGTCAVVRDGKAVVRARLTRTGRALLRRARRMRVTVALVWTPPSGRPLERRSTVTLRR
jgi:hypothetical protein